METPDISWLPAWMQQLLSLAVFVGLVAVSLWKYFRDTGKEEEPPANDHMKLIAAFSDQRAVEDLTEQVASLAQTAKEYRAISDRSEERDIERHSRLLSALERIASALERRQ